MLKQQKNLLSWLGEKEWLAPLLWFGLSLVVAFKEFFSNNYNNYTIFKHVYLHTIQGKTLYGPYPEYFDVNNYGPLFSVLITPFALMPDMMGAILWMLFNAAVLYIAIRQLPLTRVQQNLVLIFASHELMAASSYFQFNPIVAACLIFSFVLIRKGKEFWAAFFIMFAALTKLYGIVGLSFFFFANNKWRLIYSMFIWGVILFVLPMALSSPSYIARSYREWYEALVFKNERNKQFDKGIYLQDISAMGFIKRVFNLHYMSNLWVIVPAMVLFAAQYLRLKYREYTSYQLYILCSALLFTVLFSSSSESPTYIIAFPAACIWYVLQPKTWRNNAFFIFLLIGCSFSHSDLVTPWVKKNIVVPYAFKAFPCLVLWLVIVYQVLTRRFLRTV
jgi:hypothetical protein